MDHSLRASACENLQSITAICLLSILTLRVEVDSQEDNLAFKSLSAATNHRVPPETVQKSMGKENGRLHRHKRLADWTGSYETMWELEKGTNNERMRETSVSSEGRESTESCKLENRSNITFGPNHSKELCQSEKTHRTAPKTLTSPMKFENVRKSPRPAIKEFQERTRNHSLLDGPNFFSVIRHQDRAKLKSHMARCACNRVLSKTLSPRICALPG